MRTPGERLVQQEAVVAQRVDEGVLIMPEGSFETGAPFGETAIPCDVTLHHPERCEMVVIFVLLGELLCFR